jgi:hypothetical protein
LVARREIQMRDAVRTTRDTTPSLADYLAASHAEAIA